MRRVVTAIAQSINIQCALNQQPMRIALESLMLGFSRTKTFTLYSMPLTPVILRGAEGEVAESILPESTLSLSVWVIVLKVPSPSTREVILHIKEPSPSGRGGTACGG